MSAVRFCAVVPAAGSGQRMAAARPKQYHALAGRTVIEHALQALLDHPCLSRLVVVLAAGDATFDTLAVAADPRVTTTAGGATRADSVAAGLQVLEDSEPDTLVLVHDAARPCVSRPEIDRLLDAAAAGRGALLALPVRDTLKRSDRQGRVTATVERDGMWQALTPQASRLDALRDALAGNRDGVTDESSALERAGHRPVLVEGDPGNIKVTRPGDLLLAEAILLAREGKRR